MNPGPMLGRRDRRRRRCDVRDWLRRAVHLFGGLIPGEVRLLPVAAQAEAEAWIRA
jgi:hypothetical protein